MKIKDLLESEEAKFITDTSGKPLKLYRGMVGDAKTGITHNVLEPRAAYAMFLSDNPHVAASYAHPNDDSLAGAVVPVYVKATKIIEFPVKIKKYFGSEDTYKDFDKFTFDDAARRLAPGEVLVARKVNDVGPRAPSLELDPDRKWSYASDIYAVNKGTIIIPAVGNHNQ